MGSRNKYIQFACSVNYGEMPFVGLAGNLVNLVMLITLVVLVPSI